MLNKGYLTCNTTATGDEVLTPLYAVNPIIKYLREKQYHTIWCPFDREHSQYVEALKEYGFDVIYNTGDFFSHEYRFNCDCIVSNPPFSKKDKILEKLYKWHIPFALLLPQNTLQSKFRTDFFIKNGLEYLGFDSRICFYTRSKDANGNSRWTSEDLKHIKTANHFASGYFCHNVLPEKLIFEKLELVDMPYCDDCEEMTERLNNEYLSNNSSM